MLGVTSAIDKGNVGLQRLPGDALEQACLLWRGELLNVLSFELRPFLRLMAEPLAQSVTGAEVFQPFIDTSILTAETAWP